ncbi:EamA family transporter [Bacillus sp. B1-b2]|uniref:EamA family transporter n=1 Tax=Bacillus sp. B1-b2 TaxID=2653201 RepID=UPI0012621AF4|nr:DMT family transporter [Bacillus sp. B1-b2]KAB7670703.1 EamA family transporter [Bacillus sp. B1-b2]
MGIYRYVIYVLIGGISYGLLSTIMKLGMKDGYSVSELLAGQYIIGLVGMFLLVISFSRKKVTIKQIFLLMLVGIPMSLTTITYGMAVKELSASIAIVFLFQFSWIGVVIESLVNKTMPSKPKLIAIIFILIGTVLSSGLIGGDLPSLTVKGICFGLIAACTFAIYIYLNSRVETAVESFSKSFIMTMGGAIVTFSIFPPVILLDGNFTDPIWIYSLMLGLFGVVVPICFFSMGMPKVGGGLGTILSAVELPVVVLLSVIVLKEAVSFVQWVGIILILIGIVIPNVLLDKKRSVYSKRAA